MYIVLVDETMFHCMTTQRVEVMTARSESNVCKLIGGVR